MRYILSSVLTLFMLGLPAQEPRTIQAVLQERLLQMEAERDRSERAYLELQAQTRPVINELTQEKQRLEEQLRHVQQENLLLDSAQETTTRASARAEQELETLQRDLEAVQAKLLEEQQEFAETLNQMRAEQQQRVSEQAEERQGLEASRTSLQERLESLLEQMAATEQSATTLRSEKEAIEQEARDIQGLNRQLEADLQESQRRESLANAQLMTLQSRVDDLQGQLQKAFEERSRAEQQRDQLAQRVHELEGELAELHESTVPRAELEQLQQSLQETLAQNQALQAALEQEQSRPDLSGDVEKIARQRDLLDAKLKTLETKLEEAEERAAREQTQRHQATEANTSLVDHIATLEESLNGLQESRELQTQEMNTLRDEQTRLETERLSMAGALAQASEIVEHYEQLQVDFLSIRNQLEDRTEFSQEQAEAIEDLQRALGASIQEAERSRRQLQALENNQAASPDLRAERAVLEANQVKARRDMRILANYIQRLRQDIDRQQEAQQQSNQERQVLINRLRELEAGQSTP